VIVEKRREILRSPWRHEVAHTLFSSIMSKVKGFRLTLWGNEIAERGEIPSQSLAPRSGAHFYNSSQNTHKTK